MITGSLEVFPRALGDGLLGASLQSGRAGVPGERESQQRPKCPPPLPPVFQHVGPAYYQPRQPQQVQQGPPQQPNPQAAPPQVSICGETMQALSQALSQAVGRGRLLIPPWHAAWSWFLGRVSAGPICLPAACASPCVCQKKRCRVGGWGQLHEEHLWPSVGLLQKHIRRLQTSISMP